ncbi:hypothetical protein N7533_013036 [Penicillium manginii]|uniref:uncharacterized protein n=1 Tax=Penicillium manginii TaxID=203109 RepID=UPI002546F221|nr:uncharacterized protein N7533_013036 [Penicillium manginii]KAJ5734633.1 hypothetical protein N7533_013036 [Penicillium manginii]
MLPTIALTSLALLPTVQGTPSSSHGVYKRCGAVGQYYDQHQADWDTHNTQGWLDSWWTKNTALMHNNSLGFAGAFGQWAMGDPDWSCLEDGSSSGCELNTCDNPVLNNRGKDVRPAYYVLESVSRLNKYFGGVSSAFSTAGLDAALSKDSWATTFYEAKDQQSVVLLKEVLNGLGMLIGIGASLAGVGLPCGAVTAAGLQIDPHADDPFQRSADLGGILGKIVIDSIESFTTANNQLMGGHEYNNEDIRSYLSHGAFIEFPGVDTNAVTDSMTAMLVGTSINQLYRAQKVFIMGGAACGDNQGIGSGPQDTSSYICRDGKAWYLYYWQENNVISTTSHQWGWVASPPGLSQLQQNEFSNIHLNVSHIINSSLDAFNVAGYNYTTATAQARTEDAITKGWAVPGAYGAAWEGIFTIPVCDVSAAIGSNINLKQFILQPYGHDSRPVWCGPICSGDAEKTKAFIDAANMGGLRES